MDIIKKLALVAHDNRKKDMVEWVKWNYEVLLQHQIVCTGTTGKLIEEALKQQNEKHNQLFKVNPVTRLRSGPLGGDQQLGAMISNGEIDILFFFWDPMEPQPHDVDVKALLRIAVLYNVPIANNRSSADFLISSPLFKQKYEPIKKDYSQYINRMEK